MNGKTSTRKSARRSIDNVILVTPAENLPPGTIVPHGGPLKAAVTTSLDQLKQDWAVINQQVVILLEKTEQTSSKTGFELDEVSFALGINAKGQIGFLAGVELGGEASITLTFKRKK